MLKAVREAKQQTTWVVNNRQFEDALCVYIERVMGNALFLAKLEQFVEKVKAAGRVNSLGQTLMKYTAPGVPDLYQGGELWNLSLVDPDNRRPVDYARRRELLQELRGMKEDEVATRAMERVDEGLPKLWVIHRALTLRSENPEWFNENAAYIPLKVEGSKLNHVIAYMRGDSVCTIVPRLTTKVNGAWQDTSVLLPEGLWRNRLTGAMQQGGRIAVKLLLKDFPVALLVRENPTHA
jgi:(1->4)-alpha-D-glucan 1-alpha-D-glucosylmutase